MLSGCQPEWTRHKQSAARFFFSQTIYLSVGTGNYVRSNAVVEHIIQYGMACEWERKDFFGTNIKKQTEKNAAKH